MQHLASEFSKKNLAAGWYPRTLKEGVGDPLPHPTSSPAFFRARDASVPVLGPKPWSTSTFQPWLRSWSLKCFTPKSIVTLMKVLSSINFVLNLMKLQKRLAKQHWVTVICESLVNVVSKAAPRAKHSCELQSLAVWFCCLFLILTYIIVKNLV